MLKSVLTPKKINSCHIFKIAIFSKFFGDLMSHIIREYADEEIIYFLYILPLKMMDVLLSVFLVSSLYVSMCKLCKCIKQARKGFRTKARDWDFIDFRIQNSEFSWLGNSSRVFIRILAGKTQLIFRSDS